MATATGPKQTQTLERKIQQLRELFADAPELGKKRWRMRFTSSNRRLRICRHRWEVPAASAPVWARCRS
jgi:hypothetical protein